MKKIAIIICVLAAILSAGAQYSVVIPVFSGFNGVDSLAKALSLGINDRAGPKQWDPATRDFPDGNWSRRVKTDYLKNINFWIRGGIIILGAGAEGYAEVFRTHYATFKKVHPGAKDDYWNPSQSWKNKYENGDPAQGEKFFLSRSLLSPVTDGLHLMKGIRNVSFVTAIVIPLGHGRHGNKSWDQYVFEVASSMVFYQIGFSAVYDGIYR